MISLRSYTTFLFLSLLAGSCFADSATIRWNTHYGNAKRVAQATKRPLLVVIENSRDTTNLIDERELDSDARKKILQKDFQEAVSTN